MGFSGDAQITGGGGGLRALVRRKQVDSAHTRSSSSSGSAHHHLAKSLSVPHLIAIGESGFCLLLGPILLLLYINFLILMFAFPVLSLFL